MGQLHRIHATQRGGASHLIFVHGLGGDARGTWMHDEQDPTALWPQWLAQDLDCHAWCLSYSAALSSWQDSAMQIPDQGLNASNTLNIEPALASGPLILIGHSLGGLVIKAAVTAAASEVNGAHAWLARLRGVVFLATPHQGAQLANLAKALSIVLRTNPQVGDMARNDAYLRSLNHQFRGLHLRRHLHGLVLTEKKPISSKKCFLRWFNKLVPLMVVPPDSADPGLAEVTPLPMDADHFGIAKPNSRDHEVYKTLLHHLRQWQSADMGGPLTSGTAETNTQTQIQAQIQASSQPKALLTHADHVDLLPREGIVVGRDDAIEAVLAFLQGTDRSLHLTAKAVGGVAGIGKTEVCKAALRAWLQIQSQNQSQPPSLAFYIHLPDHARSSHVLAALADGLGLQGIQSLGELAQRMPPGLYYLDNLEGLADDPHGLETLRALTAVPGVRLLVSSRVSFRSVLGPPLELDVLPLAAALQLFHRSWSGPPLPQADEPCKRFVAQELGCHALSIVLTARLGDVWGWPGLQKRWREEGVKLAGSHEMQQADRLTHLAVSLRLSAQALAPHTGALALWTAVALFEEPLSDSELALLEQAMADSGIEGATTSRQALVRHHVLNPSDAGWRMLPPLARYARAQSLASADGFSWSKVRAALQRFWATPLQTAAGLDSSEHTLSARHWVLAHWASLESLLRHELSAQDVSELWIKYAHVCMGNLYQFRPLESRQLLTELITVLTNSGSAFLSQGFLEARLGQLDQASKLYKQALALFKVENDELGQANTLKALGDLSMRLERLNPVRELYRQALALYEKNSAGLGQANTLRAQGDLESRLGELDKAGDLYKKALVLYEKEGAGLGKANTLRALGDLSAKLDQWETAQGLYENALSLYRQEPESMGVAYTLTELARCAHRQGQDNQKLLTDAVAWAARSGAPNVERYVVRAAAELWGKEKALSWLEQFKSEAGA